MNNLKNDVYYQKDYLALYLEKGQSIFEFNYKENDNFFYNIAIKRPINQIGNIVLEEEYFDLETAYGYGGYYTNSKDKKFIEHALNAYKERCIDEKIIAEFIRFHPFNDFPLNNKDFLSFCDHNRDIVYIDLSLTRDERWSTYSKKTRNLLRHCEKQLSFQMNDNLDGFSSLYNETMRKNNALDFYYFSKEYYQSFLKGKNVELVFNETYGLLSNATAAVVTSGTASLEIALFKVPQVACYKTNWITYVLAKNLIKIRYLSLVNILMDKLVVKELIQADFNKRNIKEELDILLSERDRILIDYDKLSNLLNKKSASKNAAQFILSSF